MLLDNGNLLYVHLLYTASIVVENVLHSAEHLFSSVEKLNNIYLRMHKMFGQRGRIEVREYQESLAETGFIVGP